MSFLYLMEQGSILKKTGHRIVLEKHGQEILDIECLKIETICLFGNIQFTTQAVKTLLDFGIEMAIFNYNGKLRGQVTPPMPKNIVIRLAQYAKYNDEFFCLLLGKSLVKAKITNARNTIKAFFYNHSEEKKLSIVLEEMRKCLERIDEVESMETLLGIEGYAARQYFSGFRLMCRGELQFERREMHPSPDPVNAMLSFGYTLLTNEITSILDGIGFEPYLGFLHKSQYGRVSLALDVIEEYRNMLIDKLVLKCINNNMFVEKDFTFNKAKRACYFRKPALKRFLTEYEKTMLREMRYRDKHLKIRQVIREQIHLLARHLLDKEAYVPLDWG